MDPHDTAQRSCIEGYDQLKRLALNLQSSWNHITDKIWNHLDPELWELSHNPWAVLQTVSTEKLKNLLSDPNFAGLIQELVKRRQEVLTATTWYQQNYPKSPLTGIAYFSMEFMLSEALPIYSGGLGNVAGDQLKAASDLGVPVTAIGLLYSRGYFRQFIDIQGNQQELYPYNDPGQLPIKPTRTPDKEWLRLKVNLPGHSVWIRVWEARVGRLTLYLLDSNDIANDPAFRGITSELYGGDRELRLKQEIVLGIGGWRALQALGIHPEVCHLNEGHAAFAVLERAYGFMQKAKVPFDIALEATRAGNLFTTHTAVSAGFDRFSPDLVAKYLTNYAKTKLEIPIEKLLSLGQENGSGEFNMAFLAIRGSGYVNGVSKLHGCVSRHLFKDLFPRYPEEEIPLGYVTNGVHMPSWDSAASDELWTEACGKARWLGKTEDLEKNIRKVTDEKIWEFRNRSRATLIDYTRKRLVRQLIIRGAPQNESEMAKNYLNPNALTMGFARRFASYKRPDLLLADEERFLRILTNPERPVQLIIAGKAHPADPEGHKLIKRWMDFISRPEVRPHVIFLSDYDMILTEHMVQGVDLWINTPRRPWEASGTSGMKVLVNGGLNLSELDGWWAEAYTPEVGWAIGDRMEHGDDPAWDMSEAHAFYDLLEKEIVPQFYSRNGKGIPTAWTEKIRESMARLTPYYSSNRVVREYTEKFYLPAATSFTQRSENNGDLAKKISTWKRQIEQQWGNLKFGELKVSTTNGNHDFEIPVFLNSLDRDAVRVELYSADLKQEMECKGALPNTPNTYLYRVKVPAAQPASNFTPRVIPYYSGVKVPLESNQVLWQR